MMTMGDTVDVAGTETTDMIAGAETTDMTADGRETDGIFFRPTSRLAP